MNPRDEQAGPEPGRRQDRSDGDVTGPDERIDERDHRIGRKIKREQPDGDEPGYANHDNVSDR